MPNDKKEQSSNDDNRKHENRQAGYDLDCQRSHHRREASCCRDIFGSRTRHDKAQQFRSWMVGIHAVNAFISSYTWSAKRESLNSTLWLMLGGGFTSRSLSTRMVWM